jgi:hypothetical protein
MDASARWGMPEGTIAENRPGGYWSRGYSAATSGASTAGNPRAARADVLTDVK